MKQSKQFLNCTFLEINHTVIYLIKMLFFYLLIVTNLLVNVWDVIKIILKNFPTVTPRLTLILGPEKNRARRNRAIGGLWDYTMQK